MASALARLEARVGLVDHEDAAATPHDAAILVALFQRLQRIDDLHDQASLRGAEHKDGRRRSQMRVARQLDCNARRRCAPIRLSMIPIITPIPPGQSRKGFARSLALGSRFEGAKRASPAATKK